MDSQEQQPAQSQPDEAGVRVPAGSLPARVRRRLWRRTYASVAVLLLAYLALAYLLLPAMWKHRERRHPALTDMPRVTHTKSDIPGDPLNVALVGTEADLAKAMLAAGWEPADPLTLRSCLKIADATVFRRRYEDAPVSNRYLWGRKQDLAFKQPVGKDPRQRHHVRFWRSESVDAQGLLLWIGAVTYDEKVGFSHTTGQITHHIAADVDAERDHLFHDLEQTGSLADAFLVESFHQIREGKNGGGDHWHTDGNLEVAYLRNP